MKLYCPHPDLSSKRSPPHPTNSRRMDPDFSPSLDPSHSDRHGEQFLVHNLCHDGWASVVSHRLARRNVKTVQLSRSFPDEIFAGNVFTVRYLVKTDCRPWGVATLKYVEASPLQGATEGVTFSISRLVTLSVWLVLSQCPAEEKRIFPGLLTSAFPFGLASYSRSCGPTELVLVFSADTIVEEDVPPWVGGSGKGRERPDPFGTIPYQFREYVTGDPYKHIEWKKTASTGALITKVLSEEGGSRDYHSYAKDASEKTISRAASLVVHFARSARPICLQARGSAGPGRARNLLSSFSRRLHGGKTKRKRSPSRIFSPDIVVEIGQAGEFVWRRSGNLYGHASDKSRTGWRSRAHGKSSAKTSSVSIFAWQIPSVQVPSCHACKSVHRRSLYRKRFTSVSTASPTAGDCSSRPN